MEFLAAGVGGAAICFGPAGFEGRYNNLACEDKVKHEREKAAENCNALKTSLPAGLLNYNRKNFMFDKAVDQADHPIPRPPIFPACPLCAKCLKWPEGSR